ncbi:FliI/YscN family ATPase [Schlesneria paludicola]|uniref:FliI/YscN family ATPase n=1 Tax=Schlesneria paludicola TaxID=360056 RepID=UPI00029A17AA|nr:FliI/YscN family ATPase [Schlesneria paludicola]
MLDLEDHLQRIAAAKLTGRVTKIVGMTIAVAGFPAPLGAIARLEADHGGSLEAEVVGFSGEETLLFPYDEMSGVRRGTRVVLGHSVQRVKVGQGLLGRIINARGEFIDLRPSPILPDRVCLHQKPIPPMSRPRIDEPLSTGVRAIDGLLTMGKGQRLGIFSGSGVGKSTLLGQIARATAASVNVVILIGERGREVREFIERDLGPHGLSRSVVVVATSDDPAILRLRAAYLGTAIAEYFRDSASDVLLMMDSVTRFAQAQREIGLAAGEHPATRGNPPSVFALLPKLLERCGRTEHGSISGFYTVLVEGDDTNEPISDTVRGILDGHIILSRSLAQQGHFPAVDVLGSVSRLMPDTTTPSHRQAASSLRQLMAARQQADDLISIGAYQAGANSVVDAALRLQAMIESYLQQPTHDASTLADSIHRLEQLRDARSEI